MQYLIGFAIALFIALTGVGAGTVTVPVLVLFLGVPAPVAVGIGLMFATAVKMILVPAQIARRNVAWRTLGFMLLGGVPGVILGSLFLKHLVNAGSQNLMNAMSGHDSGDDVCVADICLLSPDAAESAAAGPQLMAGVADVSRWRRGGLFFGWRGGSGLGRAAQPDDIATRASGGHGYCFRLRNFIDRQRRALVLARLEH